MNVMQKEQIKHEEAQKASAAFHSWTDLLDNTADLDRHCPKDEAEARQYYQKYFTEVIQALNHADDGN